MRFVLCALAILFVLQSRSLADDLAPFAVNAKTAPKAVKLGSASQVSLPCTGKDAGWTLASAPLRNGEQAFAMDTDRGKPVLRLIGKSIAPQDTYLAYRIDSKLIKPTFNYVSITAKTSQAPVQLLVYLNAAGYKTTVTIKPGEAQKIVLPYSLFNGKGGAKIIGLGLEAASDSDVLISDISLGTAPYSADYLRGQRTMISLLGEWKFATDDGDRGSSDKWFAPGFDDSKWKNLKSGIGWTDQGVNHAGWAWYRQKIDVPKENDGQPLSIVLAELPYEDDVWFNGVHIGGLTGNYKYNNLLLRTYSVPPSAVHFGQANEIAVRAWGVNGVGTSPSKGGLTAGTDRTGTYYVAELDPFGVRLRKQGEKEEAAPDRFDLSDAQHGMAFDTVCRFPDDVLKKGGSTCHYTLTDFYGDVLATGDAPLKAGSDGLAQAIVPVDATLSQTIYLRGRFKLYLVVAGEGGNPLCCDERDVDRLSFANRDNLSLPAQEASEQTPYGQLKLIDDIDTSLASSTDPHPYMQSGFDHAQSRCTPGSPVDVTVSDILGKKARECGFGWFAYRIGRGKLTPHKNYLVRIEYPEDKPRYSPIELQVGHNYYDVGWKNGVSANDPYDNWPLSHKWETYDAIVSLDDETVGSAGTGGASAENGFWIYFMNKIKPGRYFQQYQGGPAIGHVKLYEIDVDKNAPQINLPKGLPPRVLDVDWERQADQPPADIVRYAKLMGYNAVSPIMLKWAFMNYGDPLSGYETTIVDGHRYWVREISGDDQTPADDADQSDTPDAPDASPKSVAGANQKGPSVHSQYLAATKQYGVQYIPRIEYGGSNDLPIDARAIGGDGAIARPDRFAQWGADLLHPATWADMSRTVDHYFKPFVADNPQLTGMLWRIRCDRMQISFSRSDVEMFCKETQTPLPDLSNQALAAWASGGAVADQYGDWWHKKRAEFHARLVAQLRSYRPDMTLYYFNWDADKWALGLRDLNTASTFVELATARFGMVDDVYDRHVRAQNRWTADDYIRMVRTGQLTDYPGWGRDYGVHTELYQQTPGMQIFAPANSFYMADDAKYLNYFHTADGVAVSNAISYDELGSRTINPKFEGNMVTPGGPGFSMAIELLSWFNSDARTLTYTVYTYGRGFADAHRRFAQAFLALPAVPGSDVDQPDNDLKLRTYTTANGTYVGVGFKGYQAKKLTVTVPGSWQGKMVTNLVTGQAVNATVTASGATLEIDAQPMELDAFLIH